MGVFDQSARYATQAEPGFVVRRAGLLAGLTLAWRSWFNPKAVPLPGGPDREADLVIVADEPETEARPWLLVFEFQSGHDPAKPSVLQMEALIFLVSARDTERGGGELRPLAVFVYLEGECPEGGKVAVRTPNGQGFSGVPVVWELAKDSAKETLAKVESGEESWGAMFWAPLMAGADEEDVIRTWQRVRDEKVPREWRASVTVVALTFTELVRCRVAWNRVLEGVTMTESAFWNEIMEQGEMRAMRQAVREVLLGRFPEIMTTDVEEAIADQPSLPLLRAWLASAARVQTGEELLEVMRK